MRRRSIGSRNFTSFIEPRTRKGRPDRFGTAYWTERDGSVWLVRRPASGLLGGMAALPSSEWSAEQPRAANPVASIRHVFTHFALQLDVVEHDEPNGDGWWQPFERLHEAGLPTLFLKAAQAVMKQDRQFAA